MDLNTLWVGKSLPPLQRLCLASAVGTGARVRLFTYEPVEGIPPGVEVVDGNEVLGLDKMVRHRKSQSVALFSDRFRYEVLAKGLGAWFDTDMLFLKAPHETGDYLVGWQEPELVSAGFIWPSLIRPSCRSAHRRSWLRFFRAGRGNRFRTSRSWKFPSTPRRNLLSGTSPRIPGSMRPSRATGGS